jgi:cell filamentation protein
MPNYVYPGTDTVKNKLDAKNLDELERLEGPLVRARRILIDSGRGPAGQFDAEHLKAIHRFLFQDVFEWAGHTRDERVQLSDGTIALREPTQITGISNVIGYLIEGGWYLRTRKERRAPQLLHHRFRASHKP